MAKKGNNPTISAFTGLKYINAIMSLVEEISNQPLYEQRISPKFIYRGITKRYISKASLTKITIILNYSRDFIFGLKTIVLLRLI